MLSSFAVLRLAHSSCLRAPETLKKSNEIPKEKEVKSEPCSGCHGEKKDGVPGQWCSQQCMLSFSCMSCICPNHWAASQNSPTVNSCLFSPWRIVADWSLCVTLPVFLKSFSFMQSFANHVTAKASEKVKVYSVRNVILAAKQCINHGNYFYMSDHPRVRRRLC